MLHKYAINLTKELDNIRVPEFILLSSSIRLKKSYAKRSSKSQDISNPSSRTFKVFLLLKSHTMCWIAIIFAQSNNSNPLSLFKFSSETYYDWALYYFSITYKNYMLGITIICQ